MLPLPWGPGFLPHHLPLLLFPSEALQNILTHPLTQVVSFCSHVLIPDRLEITALTPGSVLGREQLDSCMCLCVCMCVWWEHTPPHPRELGR